MAHFQKPDTYILDTIEESLKDIKEGKVVIVVDDEDRENEGDFVCAALAMEIIPEPSVKDCPVKVF